MYNSMILHVQAAWKSAPPITGLASDAPTTTLVINRALKKYGKQWQKRFDDMSQEIATKFADKSFGMTDTAMKATLADAGFAVKFNATPRAREDYHAVISENVGLIRNIPQQALQEIRTATWQSVMRGHDLATLTTTLKEKHGMTWRRAELIARDQNNKAKASLENTRRAELGITQAFWLHSGGGKVPRPEHVAFSGKPYSLKKGAYLEKKWVWPGTEVNCRCVSRAMIPGLDASDY